MTTDTGAFTIAHMLMPAGGDIACNLGLKRGEKVHPVSDPWSIYSPEIACLSCVETLHLMASAADPSPGAPGDALCNWCGDKATHSFTVTVPGYLAGRTREVGDVITPCARHASAVDALNDRTPETYASWRNGDINATMQMQTCIEGDCMQRVSWRGKDGEKAPAALTRAAKWDSMGRCSNH